MKRFACLLFMLGLLGPGCGTGSGARSYRVHECGRAGNSAYVEVEPTSGPIPGIQALMFDRAGVTFHLSQPYSAAAYADVELFYSAEKAVLVVSLVGGAFPEATIEGVNPECFGLVGSYASSTK